MILAILFAYFGYKKANSSGRNGILWGFVALAVFIGIQLVAGLLVGSVFVAGVIIFGWSETIFEDYETVFNIIGIIAGIIGGYLVLKYLDRIPQDETYNAPPLPPRFKE